MKVERAQAIAETWVAWLAANVTHTPAPISNEELRQKIAAMVLRIAAEEAEPLLRERDALWRLLDDIDTLDDSCREHDDVFRARVREVQKKRWAIHNPDKVT